MHRILMIDDDAALCGLLCEFFTAEGFGFTSAACGDDGLRLFEDGGADIVILDVMLPGRDGLDVLSELRSRSRVPVVMLTAKGEQDDRIAGLEIGADDYICKPFNTRELAARVRAVLRRYGEAERSPGDLLRVADIVIDRPAHSVTVGGRGVQLTGAEMRLLEELLTHAGRVVSLEELSVAALKRSWSLGDRSLSVHMSNLRRKLGPYPSGDERIATIRGEGFIYVVRPQA